LFDMWYYQDVFRLWRPGLLILMVE